MTRETEDDVEGHRAQVRAPEGATTARAPEGAVLKEAEDDVEGHRANRKSPEGAVLKEAEDDVEGHSIGTMNPVLARDLARAKESDIQRATSRNNLISEVRRALRRKD